MLTRNTHTPIYINFLRPKHLNALCSLLMSELLSTLERLDDDPKIGAIVITGSGRAFAAGADIEEVRNGDLSSVHKKDFLAGWENVATIRKPVIAAVNGLALGEGCEVTAAGGSAARVMSVLSCIVRWP